MTINNFLEFGVIAILAFLFVWYFGFAIYVLFIKDHVYNYRERKYRKLYPEYFIFLDARDHLQNNELREARYRENSARQDIDLINKEMPYTPLEETSGKQMMIEALKKEKAKAKAEIKGYEDIIDEYNRQMREMRQDNKKLMKLWEMQW